jgi:hypothetical protein
VVAVGALVPLNAAISNDRKVVNRITFSNDTTYDIHISVGDDDGNVLLVGVALQHCATTFEQVLDQGAMWHIRFRSQGRDGGEAVVSETELASADWSYRIPDSVGEHLRASGAPPPPARSCPTMR